MTEVRICFENDGTALGVYGPIVIAAIESHRAFSAHAARRAVEEISELRRTTHRHGLIYAYVMGEFAEIPGLEARSELARLPELIDVAIGVHEGSGFRASVIRAVVTGIAMAARMQAHPEIVATVSAAAERIHRRVPSLREPAIVAALEGVRRAALEGE